MSFGLENIVLLFKVSFIFLIKIKICFCYRFWDFIVDYFEDEV